MQNVDELFKLPCHTDPFASLKSGSGLTCPAAQPTAPASVALRGYAHKHTQYNIRLLRR